MDIASLCGEITVVDVVIAEICRAGMGGDTTAPASEAKVFLRLRNPSRLLGLSAVSGVPTPLGLGVTAGAGALSELLCGVKRSRSVNSEVFERRRFGVDAENIATAEYETLKITMEGGVARRMLSSTRELFVYGVHFHGRYAWDGRRIW
jgi:hypothetical protein